LTSITTFVDSFKGIVEEEFPEDPALQQIHVARKIIAKEAELKGLTFFECIKTIKKQVKES
jgi:hypothetical protein